MWHHTKPNVSHLRIFETIAYIHIPKAERRKLDSKSLKCFFVGYALTQKAYRFWEPITRRIKISRDVIFDEKLHHISDIPNSPDDVDSPNFFFRLSAPTSRDDQPQVPDDTRKEDVAPQATGEINIDVQPEPPQAIIPLDAPTQENIPALVNEPNLSTQENSTLPSPAG